MAVFWFVLGSMIVGIVAVDIFQAVLVPRPTARPWRPSSILNRSLWQAWGWVANRFAKAEFREDFLGGFAPSALVMMLLTWIAALVVGYGLMFFALQEQIKPRPDLGEAIYFAGTSLLTIGYGDFAPTGAAVRIISLLAGATGLGSFAVITAFLFAVFGAYQQREAFVVMFSNRAGAPPSAIDMIEMHAQLGIVDNLVETIHESQIWIAQVLETHLAYPILTFFRSTHDDISWIAVIGTILDTSTLAITTLDLEKPGEAMIVNRLGRHLVNDFAEFFGLGINEQIGIDRSEFDSAYERLRETGVPLRERGQAWNEFSTIRATYAGHLNTMARYWRIPPARWIGDRSFIHHPPLEIGETTVPSVVAGRDR